jgi:hypothetical protein
MDAAQERKGLAMTWMDNDLTKLARGTPAGVGSVLDGYAQSDGSQHVNFIDASGHVHELYKSPDPAAQWVDNDLTKLAAGTPTPYSALNGYVEGDGSQHVNYVADIDDDADVHELYRSPGPAAQWVDNNLTKFSPFGVNADPFAVDGYVQGDGSQHVNYVAADGSGVHELYRSPDPAAQWVDNGLTKLAGATSTSGRAFDGYAQSDGSQHVNFIDTGNHVHELYKSPDPAAQWVDNDLTKLAEGTPANGFALNGYAQSDGSQHVNFIDASGHVHELYKSPDPAARWVDNDLTKLAGGTPAFNVIEENCSPLDGYAQSDGSRYIYFIDASGHVHELYKSADPAAQWVDNDLTKLAGGTPAFNSPTGGISGLDGYAQGDGSQHVNYVDVSGHVHELYRSP